MSGAPVKRIYRLTRSTDFQRVRRYGKTLAHPLVLLVAMPNQLPISRFGFVAAGSLGKAVQRNRAKRLLRAALQSLLSKCAVGWDTILIARKPLVGATFQETQAALAMLLSRACILRENHDA